MPTVYRSWRDFPTGEWRWPSFSPQEMASKREGELLIDPASMDKLQALRNTLGKPFLITSAYRSEAHNKAVGGAKKSQHRLGKAFDVRMENHDPGKFEIAARAAGFTGFGHYPKSGFMHIDTGPARRWNDGSWFKSEPVATPGFQAVSEPKAETLKDIATKPEVLMGAGSVLAGAGGVSQGTGPVQIAFAIVLVVFVIGLGAYVTFRLLNKARD